jgi:hypothetical protein
MMSVTVKRTEQESDGLYPAFHARHTEASRGWLNRLRGIEETFSRTGPGQRMNDREAKICPKRFFVKPSAVF